MGNEDAHSGSYYEYFNFLLTRLLQISPIIIGIGDDMWREFSHSFDALSRGATYMDVRVAAAEVSWLTEQHDVTTALTDRLTD